MKPFEVEILEKSIEQKGNMLSNCYDEELHKSWSSDLQKRFPSGGWRTMNGAKVFVNGGKVVAGLDGFNGEIDKFFKDKVSYSKEVRGERIRSVEIPVKEFDSAFKLKNYLESIPDKDKSMHPSTIDASLNFKVPMWIRDGEDKLYFNKTKNGYQYNEINQESEKVKENQEGGGDFLKEKRNIWIPNMTKGKLDKLLQKDNLSKDDIEDLKDFKYFLLTDKQSGQEKGFYQKLQVSQKGDAYVLKDKFLLTNIENKLNQKQSPKNETKRDLSNLPGETINMRGSDKKLNISKVTSKFVFINNPTFPEGRQERKISKDAFIDHILEGTISSDSEVVNNIKDQYKKQSQ